MIPRTSLPTGSPDFTEGALVALLGALGAGLAHGLLAMVIPESLALTLVFAGLGLGYLLYLLRRSSERAGHLVMPIGWLAATALAWSLSPGPWTQAWVQVGWISVLRCLYFQSGPLGALADLGLAVLGLAAGLMVAGHTGSLALAVWCLLLIQAPFASLPGTRSPRPEGPDRFDLAERAAASAVQRLSHRH